MKLKYRRRLERAHVPPLSMNHLVRRHPLRDDVWYREEPNPKNPEQPTIIVSVRHGRFIIAGSPSVSLTLKELLLTIEHEHRGRAA